MQRCPVASYLPLILLLLCGSAGTAAADRALSPTDALGNWAIESRLKCCGPWETSHVYSPQSGGVRTQDIASSRLELGVRVWPIRGLFLGLQAGSASPGDDDTRSWADREEVDAAWTDAVLQGGYRRRLSPSIVTGASLHLTLPTGTSYGTTEQWDVEARTLLGFSFTPRWDFFSEPQGGWSSESTFHGGGYRVGWSAGFAFQSCRVSLVGRGTNRWHQDDDNYYVSTGGDIALAWELRPGLLLGIEFEANEHRESSRTDDTFVELLAGFSLTWVYYPNGHPNDYRREDRRRGKDWKWWGPPGRR